MNNFKLIIITTSICSLLYSAQPITISNLKRGKSITTTSPKQESMFVTNIAALPTNNGLPTIESIKNLICNYYINPTEKDNIVAELFSASHKVYAIYLKNTDPKKYIFFLKLIHHELDYIQKMIAIQKEFIGQTIHNTKWSEYDYRISKKDLPIITWVEHFFVYKTKRTNILEVTHAAQGTTIKEIINHSEYIIPCAKALGKALGSFQQLFMQYDSEDPTNWKTISHQDFHYENVLYNITTQKVYFIDWGDMKINKSPFIDIQNIMNNPSGIHISKENKILFFDIFLYEYTMSFPKNKRKFIAHYLLDKVLTNHFAQEIIEENFKLQKLYQIETTQAKQLAKAIQIAGLIKLNA